MKFLKWFLIILVSLLIILAVVGFFLPQKVHLERSIIIGANRDTVFTQINSMQNFNQWSPWYKLDPNANYQYSGPDAGKGNRMSWSSQDPNVGKGSQEIVESQYPSLVRTELLFGDDPNPGYAEFSIEEITYTQTRVTWGFDADFGNNIVGRYFGLFLESMLGPQYEEGLKALKEQVES
ncbi:MAG: SRPBCC family protein [Gammaproteobacteria bacterium]|nr:SRPBCC family protein [Gammaproteobacteria bacterium]